MGNPPLRASQPPKFISPTQISNPRRLQDIQVGSIQSWILFFVTGKSLRVNIYFGFIPMHPGMFKSGTTIIHKKNLIIEKKKKEAYDGTITNVFGRKDVQNIKT
jgi:hypothetical protein